jgi:hypothetical protein
MSTCSGANSGGRGSAASRFLVPAATWRMARFTYVRSTVSDLCRPCARIFIRHHTDVTSVIKWE